MGPSQIYGSRIQAYLKIRGPWFYTFTTE